MYGDKTMTIHYGVDTVDARFAPQGQCPQHKIWQYCPVSEQIRQSEREKVLDKLERLLCAHHKYVGSYRVITGTNEEIYDELFDAMQDLRHKDGE